MKMYAKKIFAILIAAIVLFDAVTALAQDSSDSGSGSLKDETIYITLDHSGRVDAVTVVNAFYNDGEPVVDYGNYTSVASLVGSETASFKNDRISFTPDSVGRFYYQGELADKAIPWDISIGYYLDGKQVQPRQLAGSDGELRLEISIKPNDSSNDNFAFFRDNYSLQTSVILDANKCKNIVAQNAAVVAVGSNKTMTFTVLPGESRVMTITADVVSFEMQPISINAVQSNISIDIDTSAISERFGRLQHNMIEVIDGAESLHGGLQKFDEGISELSGNVDRIGSNAQSLLDGSNRLGNGLSSLSQNGSLVVDRLDQMQESIQQSADRRAQLTQLAGALAKSGDAQVRQLAETALALLDDVTQMNQQIAELGTEVKTYTAGVGALSESYNAFDSSLNSHAQNVLTSASNLSTMSNDASAISDKVDELVDMQKQMQNGMSETANMINHLTEDFYGNKDVSTNSFVSSKNNVQSTQFVMRTQYISIPQHVRNPVVSEQTLNIWQRLLRLFRVG